MKLARILIACLILITLTTSTLAQQEADSSSLDVSLTAQNARAIGVRTGESGGIVSLVADPQSKGGDIFDIISNNPNAAISLVLPGGMEINATNAASLGFKYQIVADGTFTRSIFPSFLSAPGTHTVIKLPPSSMPGTYQVKVQSSPATSDYFVVASYYSSSPVKAALVTDFPQYPVGDTVVISGLLFDGKTPITGATVTAVIGDPSNLNAEPVQITLQDSGSYDDAPGDGIYTGTFNANQAGDFSVAIRASGVSGSGVPFARVAETTFKVSQPLANFVSFQDAGVDDDANGLIDRIVVTATVDIRVAGNYRFNLTLVAGNGSEITASALAALQTGPQQISVSFSAQDIYGLNVDGPYQMKNAILTLQDETDASMASRREAAGNTATYKRVAIQPPALYFTGQLFAFPQDTDGNGKYNNLTIYTGIRVSTEGAYDWSAVLVDSLGNRIERISGSVMLWPNTTLIVLTFDGNKIGRNAVDGPYSLQSVLISGAGDSASVQQLWKTRAYSASEFEGGFAPAFGIKDVAATGIGGNGNSTIEPGEDGSLKIQLTNTGGAARNVSATLTTSTPGVTILTGTSRYPDVASSANAGNETLFTFRTAGTLPVNSKIDFTLNLTSASGSPQTLQFPIQVGGVVIPPVANGKIAFAVGNQSGGQREIYLMNADGSGQTNITHNATDDFDPEWSPDGLKIVFAASEGSFTDIYVMNAGGSGRTRLTDSIGREHSPAWSPDNSRIVFVTERDCRSDIYVMNTDGSDQKLLIRGFGFDVSPAWSPDGTKIIWTAQGAGGLEIAQINSDGSGAKYLTNTAGDDTSPSWSLDGSKIVFASKRDGNAEIYVMNANGSNQTRLTSNTTDDLAPAWSPDANKIVFTSVRDGNSEIYVMNADGTGQTRLTINTLNDANPAWQPLNATVLPAPTPTPTPIPNPSPLPIPLAAPNGRIAFKSTDGMPRRSNFSPAIYLMDPDGSNRVKVAGTDFDIQPVWSPDGNRLLVTSSDGSTTAFYIINSDGSNRTLLTTEVASGTKGGWSPDGTKVVFTSIRDGNNEIYVINTDGTNLTRLTNNTVVDEQPAWSPGGDKIAFVSRRNGFLNIFVMNADGTNQVNLSNDFRNNNQPAWSPDGAKIAFVAARGTCFDGEQIYAMNADGSNVVNLTNTSGRDHPLNNGAPAWSPDGQHIVFVRSFTRFSVRNDEIFVMDADGSNQAQLIDDGALDIQPDWQRLPATPVGNTQSGSNVSVSLGAVTITFTSVSTAGTTTATSIDPQAAGNMPGGVVAVGNLAFEIETTATFSGPIIVSFNVPSITDPTEFSDLRVLHGENGALVDRTILSPDQPAPDFAARIISARVSSLSPFVLARVARKANTATAITSSASASTYGQQVTFTATVSGSVGTPTGLVEFFDGPTSLGKVNLNGGHASLSISNLDAGTHNITAVYAETDGYSGSTSPVLSQTVSRVKPSINVTGGTYTYDGNPHQAAGSASGINGENLGIPTFTYNGASAAPVNAGSYEVTASFGGDANYEASSATGILVITKAAPSINWNAPASINYGTELTSAQLNATASVAGSIAYSPAAGIVLNAGAQTLSATFAPADAGNYQSVTASVHLNVLKATPTISWSNPSDIVYGTPLGSAQLNATASVPGNMSYTPAAGALLNAGAGKTLSLTFTPNDVANYNNATTSVTINVTKAPLTITAANATRLLGAPNPPLRATYSGFVAGQGPEVLAGTLSFTTTASTNSPVGVYPVSPGGLTSSNYAINFINGSLSIGYKINLLYDETKVAKSGSTIPIKIQLTDVNGVNMSAANIIVHAGGILMTSTDAPEELADTGNANPDNNFRYDATLGGNGGYIFNLSTRGYPTGTFVLSFTAGNNAVTHTTMFRVRE
jgi:Tol biopolymer transport system component